MCCVCVSLAVLSRLQEDADLFSINYLHFGAPKVWYCVSPKDRAKFERMAQSMFPELHKNCPAFMRHKDILLSPSLLKNYGVEYMQVGRGGVGVVLLHCVLGGKQYTVVPYHLLHTAAGGQRRRGGGISPVCFTLSVGPYNPVDQVHVCGPPLSPVVACGIPVCVVHRTQHANTRLSLLLRAHAQDSSALANSATAACIVPLGLLVTQSF